MASVAIPAMTRPEKSGQRAPPMSQVKWVQSLFSRPGGMGNYLDTVYEFLVGLEPRATTRDDAFGWFQKRFNAVKYSHYNMCI